MPDIQFVGTYYSSTAVNPSTPSVTVVPPTGTVAGDYVFALITLQNNTSVSTPANWTLLSAVGHSRLYYRVHPVGTMASATFTIGAGEATCAATSWRNVDSINVVDNSSAVSSQYTPPNSAVPAPQKRMALSFYSAIFENGITSPSGNPVPTVAAIIAPNNGNTLVPYPSMVAYGMADTFVVPYVTNRYSTTSSGFSRQWYGHTVVLNRTNSAPTVSLTPLGTAQRGVVTRADHTFTDADAGDYQSRFDHQTRKVGESVWNPVTVYSANPFYNYGANSFSSVGMWERQVRVFDELNVASAWSASDVFQVVERPAKPVIIFPALNARVAANTRISWTAASQDAYEIEIRDENGVVEWTSGVVESAPTRSADVSFPTLGNKQIALRVRYTTLWSTEWAVVAVEAVSTPVTSLDRVVDPFVAQDYGYDTVNVSWTPPLPSSWTGIRLVRSRNGIPIVESDGILVVEDVSGSWNSLSNYQNTGLTGGWHYYALFLKGASGWVRVGATSVLLPYDYGSTDKLWDTIPEYYKNIQDDAADMSLRNTRINPALYLDNSNSEPNLLLSSYLNLFGLGFDHLRTQAEHVLGGYDVNVVHSSRLALLAKQFGKDLEQAVPSYANRTVVRNLAYLYRKRGTLSGIRETVAMATGWDIEVTLGKNLMLSEDQSAFVNPDYDQWDPTKLYTAGGLGDPPRSADRVRYGSYIFQAIGPSRGPAQAPPSAAASNTWWSYIGYPRHTRHALWELTNDVSTWQAEYTPGGVLAGNTFLGVGATEPEATLPQVSQSNTLAVYRTSSSGSTNVKLFSVPTKLASGVTANQREMVVRAAIPVPKAVAWVNGKEYPAGAIVEYQGVAYESLDDENTSLPTVTTAWTRLGYDDRVGLTLSFFAHGPFTGGGAGTGGQPATPYFTEYDETGTVLRTVEATTATYPNTFFDAFADDSPQGITTSPNRHLPTGNAWSIGTGTVWSTARDSNGGYAVPPAGRSNNYVMLSASTGMNNLNIAATYTADPGTARRVGVIFRRTDANNYWIASQTGLYKVVAGAAPANPASGALTWAKFNAGERIRVNLNGDVISVYKNNTLLGSATDSFGNAGIQHGIGIETN